MIGVISGDVSATGVALAGAPTRAAAGRRMHVLVLSRNYPNPVLDRLGLWVERQTMALSRLADVTVMAPVPYWPPLPGPRSFRRFRTVPERRRSGDVHVEHPRFVVGPGNLTQAFEARSYYRALRPRIARLHAARPVDLIHAHFSYADGTAAAWIGQEIGVPVVVTEHNLWRPWMDDYPGVRRQTVDAMKHVAAHVVVSRAVQRSIESFTGPSDRFHVIPIGVDGSVFEAGPPAGARPAAEVLFVGWVNYVKGVDVLLRAIALVRASRPDVHVSIVGGALYRHTGQQERELRALAAALGLERHVTFVGPLPPVEVAQRMRTASLLAVPSRRESCGAVILEALASGLPVVATACGGPDDLVTPEAGLLVPPEDPPALAAGIERMLAERARYDPARLRAYALERFSWDHLAVRYREVYERAVIAAGGRA